MLRFQITQHTRDRLLIINIINYLGCGRLREGKDIKFLDIDVQKFSDIQDKIIPFFNKYSILGIKALDFSDFTPNRLFNERQRSFESGRIR